MMLDTANRRFDGERRSIRSNDDDRGRIPRRGGRFDRIELVNGSIATEGPIDSIRSLRTFARFCNAVSAVNGAVP